ncbi:PAS domain S-box protein [Phreatobacter aquaticus]|uniref:PAS domain S-box protein n=1 Tax=Phreatobacter aquaticus TaxID=2570229 RepID=A0A4D7QK06_9HYPH|nr:PAS domain-containing protein [Phreatobacter aquaticus]QCK84652.1 PAS domain S-box protein [Phreatobacter aquaticus]
MAHAIRPTGREVFFDPADIIVSKTDLKGRITYANDVFIAIAGFSERELLGQPHSIIRHPDMPRAVFKLLWDTLAKGEEIFAYVKNMARSGDHYWVFAHVTPSYDAAGTLVSYHSNRRVPKRAAIDAIAPVYAELCRVEAEHRNGKEALAASSRILSDFVVSQKIGYDELVLAL